MIDTTRLKRTADSRVAHRAKGVLFQWLIVGVLFPVSFTFLVLSCTQKPAAATNQASSDRNAAAQTKAVSGTIVYVDGSVSVNGKPATIGQTVASTDTVKTGDASVAEITFSGRNIIQIEANTLTTLDLSGADRGANLKSGALALVLKQLGPIGAKPGFRVTTQNAVGGVRGTAFYVKVESPDRTYFCLCNGELSLADSGGGNASTVTAAHHKAIRFIRNGASIAAEPAPMLYHTDAQMQALAGKIGYTIDWNKADTHIQQ